jgi:RNA polymerase sigma factor (sigma-70 family)
MVDFYTDRTYKDYYVEVGQHALLTPTEEKALLVRYKSCPQCHRRLPHLVKLQACPKCGEPTPARVTGRLCTCSACTSKFEVRVPPKVCPRCGSPRDLEARDRLVQANLRFVVRRARSFTNKPEYIHQLISAGNVGLMLAIDKYDLSRNTRFLTYAEWWIRKEMLDEIHNSRLIHIPTHKQKAILREKREGVFVCTHCGLRAEQSDNRYHIRRCLRGKEHDFVLPTKSEADLMSDTKTIDDVAVHLHVDVDIERETIDADMEETIRQVIRSLKLSERDRFILVGFFDVPQDDRKTSTPKSLHQLAALTGVTPERVRQIKEQALRQFKKELVRRSISGPTS